MRLLPLSLPDDGLEYGVDLLGHPGVVIGYKTGLPFRLPSAPLMATRFRMVRMRLRHGFAINGAFFGTSGRWYHLESIEQVELSTGGHDTVRMFLNAETRKDAKVAARVVLPAAKFFR